MSLLQNGPLPPDHGGPKGQFLNLPILPGKTRREIAMAEDPPGAGCQEVLRQGRPHEDLGIPRPASLSGYEISALNSSKHRCTATKRTPAEEAEYQLVRGEQFANLRPEVPEEIEAAERCTESRFMWSKCNRAIGRLAIDLIDQDKARRKAPAEAKVARIEASLFLWERLERNKYPFGVGYGDHYEILLKDLDPECSIKNLRSPKARVFAYLHSQAKAPARLVGLLEKFRATRKGRGQDPEYDEYLAGLDRLEAECGQLTTWVMKHVSELRHELEAAKRELARVDATPGDPDLILLLSDEYRKLKRYQDEHERAYYRNLNGFQAIRRRLMSAYDQGMGAVQKKYDVMFKVGPLGIHLPDSLASLCPYDQLEAMIRIMMREQRYYDPSSRNGCRMSAEMAQASENQGISAATWGGVDSDGKGGKRIIGGETSLMPPPGAPKPPDEPEPPR
ncbi:MAG: hypothetical protein U0800_03215 [Isosphaeraceae bacterium]